VPLHPKARQANTNRAKGGQGAVLRPVLCKERSQDGESDAQRSARSAWMRAGRVPAAALRPDLPSHQAR
jgi:hypothetical protein